MGLFWAFLPFVIFAVAERFVSVICALLLATLVSSSFLLRDRMVPGRSLKILDIGTAALFGGLALYALIGGRLGSLLAVRLTVDIGLLAIVLVSIAIRRPFTLQYAREQVSRELWSNPVFIRTNDIITMAWALAFVVMVAADTLLLYVPQVPAVVGVIATALALAAAIRFTLWYPQRVRRSPV